MEELNTNMLPDWLSLPGAEMDHETFLDENPNYIKPRRRPMLLYKRITIQADSDCSIECSCCYDSYSKHSMVSFECNHEFCVDCVTSHFNHSPKTTYYSCPICRQRVTRVTMNYSKLTAKNIKEAKNGNVATQLKEYAAFEN